jgi:hypothetical protein
LLNHGVCIMLFVLHDPLITTGACRSFLKEQGVSDNANGVISEFYGKHGSIISSHMSVTGKYISFCQFSSGIQVVTVLVFLCIGISAAQIVGIDWRLDYSVRSKHAGQDNTPLFLLSLKIKEANSEAIKPVEIIATQEELQDMLSKVRDAVKQVERVVVGNANTA